MSATPDKTPPAADLLAEPLHEELARLVREYRAAGDESTIGQEAWNLVADCVIENIDTIVTRLSAEPAGAGWPEGWKLVPIALTSEMRRAGARGRQNSAVESFAAGWRFALAAAPPPPAPEAQASAEICLKCDGRGFSTQVESHRRESCSVCNGTGRVPEPAPIQAAVEKDTRELGDIIADDFPMYRGRTYDRRAALQEEGDAVERTADAIDAARYAHPVHPRERERPFSQAGKWDREYAFRLARAALSATTRAGEPPLGHDLSYGLGRDTSARAVDVEAGAQWLAENVLHCMWEGLLEGTCTPKYPAWKVGAHANAGKEDYRIAVRSIIAAARASNADVDRETIERCAQYVETRDWWADRVTLRKVAAGIRALQPAPGKRSVMASEEGIKALVAGLKQGRWESHDQHHDRLITTVHAIAATALDVLRQLAAANARADAADADVERETIERCAAIVASCSYGSAEVRFLIAEYLRALQPAPGKTGGA